ncbi:GNAT family N-acetyltransferase [Aeromicrobium fastidiosum]|uniref:Lysine N-acyltransferase MbtK n=1 Tax=Aeromicrobium fastidiosum TaxID=52699 RepID=A0A641APG7_9ACTN|nr:GNAT family N-acetyltransferase [Aeromicrobium fastidiosum]KAA1379980.1 GNAT family N-acetyltransferase [Aeromicrobium fastidiosum]MBP2389498.1 siderophore synthetase component/RimJ/RimL family protein N-acetyltransferase [Aeromicrobium fastidiosum]
MTADVLLARETRVGRITIEPVDVDRDGDLLHAWITHPRSVFWGMQDATVQDVWDAYAAIVADPHHDAWLGRVDGAPAFLAETYDPEHSELAGRYDWQLGDIGMHLLVAPTDEPRSGFTSAVFRTVMELCLDDPRRQRVVVEPDVRNRRIAALNAAAGFRVVGEVELSDKVAALSICTRADFEASQPTTHLTDESMGRAHRMLVAKAIGEFAHERLLDPRPVGVDHEIVSPDGRVRYRFHAHRYELDHWVVGPWSIHRTVDDEAADVDALAFVVEHAEVLGIPDDLLPTYLEEISSTLAGSAWKHVHHTTSARDLVGADFQAIEAAMTEGHPAFVANNGRIGFSVSDYEAYAPETGSRFTIVWVAARRELAHLSLGEGLEEQSFYAGELDAAARQRFDGTLRGRGLEPSDYLLVPVHPWQWEHKIAITFAADLGRGDLVLLGHGDDEYQAQQSIRTYFNTSRRDRHYVKTALSIQNMGFMRGLSPRYMRATPAINDWVADVVASDDELRSTGFGVLRERAAIGYTGDVYHRLGTPSPYTKMLAALWRESPEAQLADGERLATMASLLHRDRDGASYAVALIRASGLGPAEWVGRYLRAYLRPVVHCLHRYELAFMPHGENLILVLDGHVPTRVVMKDIGEEIAVLGDIDLPADVERVRAQVPPDVKALSVLTDVFDGFLRFLAAILAEDGMLASDDFWALVARTISEHQDDHPELAEAFARIDLFAPEFAHSCLNRLQLRDTRQMVDLSDQAESLLFAGTLDNPIARYRR